MDFSQVNCHVYELCMRVKKRIFYFQTGVVKFCDLLGVWKFMRYVKK